MGREDRRRLVRAACLAVTLVASAGTASANGRYPLSQQLLVDPGDPNRLWLRATYGLLTSEDGGKSWDWICESVAGYGVNEDPMLAITAEGRVFVAAAHGLFSTPDHGCSWSANPDIGDNYVRDIAVEGNAKRVLVLRTTTEPNGNYDLVVFRSDEEGNRFAPLGPPISLDLVGQTIDPAPSDPNRIYVTATVWPSAPAANAGIPSEGAANANAPGILLRSRDGGTTWERLIVPGASSKQPPLIAAIHPTNPDILYLRLPGEVKDVGTIESTLLYSEDAGTTWRNVFHASADMLGFSLSQNGAEVRFGLGDSRDPTREVDPAVLGIYVATAPTFSFERRLSGQIGCLTDTAAGLFVCGSHFSEGFELGESGDDGVTASRILDFGGVRGPLVCPATSATHLQCDSQWEYACSPIGDCSKAAGRSSSDPGTPAPTATSGGCGCGAPGSEKKPTSAPNTVGTARLSVFPESWKAFVIASLVGVWVARRQMRRTTGTRHH